jgi:hypothetical protein
MNHSCDPNAAMNGRNLVAVRAVLPGEEIAFDYNTNEYEMATPFLCRCGSPACAGLIRGFKYLTLPERERLRPLLNAHLLHLLEHDTEVGGHESLEALPTEAVAA